MGLVVSDTPPVPLKALNHKDLGGTDTAPITLRHKVVKSLACSFTSTLTLQKLNSVMRTSSTFLGELFTGSLTATKRILIEFSFKIEQ